MESVEALVTSLVGQADARLVEADADLARRYPGDPVERRPVHTVYVPADRYEPATPRHWGDRALELLDDHAPDAATAARATGLDPDLVARSLDRVRAKLADQPVEDLRVDLEDGYGVRPDEEEDAAVRSAVAGLASYGSGEPWAPTWYGVRFKSLEAPTRARGVRSLVQVVAGLAAAGRVPERLRLTLPKVTSVDQVRVMVDLVRQLETALGLPAGSLTFEIQVETPQAVMAPDGTAAVAAMVHAAAGRCTGLHFGTFDYSAALGITAAYQSADHPAADHAKAVMQLAAAQTGVTVSDGSTNVAAFGDTDAAHATWRLHARLVTRALERGIYQGWDMHPGHLVSRYLATFCFFRAALPGAATRLRGYVDRVEGGVMDEPATARALAGAVLRGVSCGAVDEAEALAACGMARAELTALVGGRRG